MLKHTWVEASQKNLEFFKAPQDHSFVVIGVEGGGLEGWGLKAQLGGNLSHYSNFEI